MQKPWESLFDELVEESATVRAARLEEIAAHDPELARFVGELLAADRTEEALIGAPILARAPVFVASALELGVSRLDSPVLAKPKRWASRSSRPSAPIALCAASARAAWAKSSSPSAPTASSSSGWR